MGETSLVNEVLLKLAICSVRDRTYADDKKSTDKREVMEKEYDIQDDLYKNSYKYGGAPICPTPLGIHFLNKREANNFINQLQEKGGGGHNKTLQALTTILENLRFGDTLRCIYMEYMHNSTTLEAFSYDSYTTENQLIQAEILARYELLRLNYCYGYVHGDLHRNNIMIMSNSNKYPVKAYLIDFGRSSKINVQLLKTMRATIMGFLNDQIVNNLFMYETQPTTYKCPAISYNESSNTFQNDPSANYVPGYPIMYTWLYDETHGGPDKNTYMSVGVWKNYNCTDRPIIDIHSFSAGKQMSKSSNELSNLAFKKFKNNTNWYKELYQQADADAVVASAAAATAAAAATPG